MSPDKHTVRIIESQLSELEKELSRALGRRDRAAFKLLMRRAKRLQAKLNAAKAH